MSDPTQAPYADRMKQAKHDAVASAKICFLPLEPRRAARGLLDALQLAWDDYQTQSAEDCANAELKAKPRIYNVRPFTQEERTEILYDARNLAAWDARENGARRRRPRGNAL